MIPKLLGVYAYIYESYHKLYGMNTEIIPINCTTAIAQISG
ncbi:hypothetical protein GXM_04284 [Nostoc sphaeroides CCNUC1]|uniref:Uncharacterized protein n=1 Tax=Nostoc sphaeroides CCNUC1 TaxID=2653204 RepID=A0A5P8W282_9NOSO|nr:hypothetical protein GXM_04284 [Nostoc sphaeroides CCNUC1]